MKSTSNADTPTVRELFTHQSPSAVAYLLLAEDEDAEVAKAALRKLAADEGFTLLGAVIEPAGGGETAPLSRPGLSSLVLMAAKRGAGVVIVRSSSELSLSRSALAAALQLLMHGGLDVVIGSPFIDTRERSTAGWLRMLNQTLGVADAVPPQAGAVPFGKRREAGLWMPHLDEQQTIARAVELHLEGLSLRSICAVLDQEGRTPRAGGKWKATTLREVLLREKSAHYARSTGQRGRPARAAGKKVATTS